MEPVKDWGRRTVIISGGSQCTLEDVSGWENLGKFTEVNSAFGGGSGGRGGAVRD